MRLLKLVVENAAIERKLYIKQYKIEDLRSHEYLLWHCPGMSDRSVTVAYNSSYVGLSGSGSA